jgi:tetratricopeptide (TPR) repeat protein
MSVVRTVPPDAGDLAEHPLPRVILELWRRGFTGALHLAHDGIELRFTWRDGALVTSQSSRHEDTLGRQLMETGRISPAQLERLVAHREKSGGAETTALLGMRLLEPKELVRTIREQTTRRLVDAFGWAHGSYRAEAGPAPSEETDAFRVDPLQVLQDGLAAFWRPDRILGDLADRLELHASPTERFAALSARLRPGPDTEAITGGVDPQRTFAETAATTLAPPRLAVAWILAETDALAFGDTPPAPDAGDGPRAAGECDADDEPRIEFEIEVRRSDGADAAEAQGHDPDALEPRSAEAEGLCKDLRALHERLGEMDHYEVLGLERDASSSAVKKAYFSAAKRFHPDAVARLGLAAFHREANELFARIAQAYHTLSNPSRRQAYDQRDESGSAPANHASRVAQAETLFRKGEVLVKVGNFTGALDFLRPCVELWPEEADYQALLGWSLYKAKPSKPEAARTHLEKADALRGDDPLTLFRLGMVLRRLGEEEAGQIYLDRSKSLEKRAGAGRG